MSTIPVICDRCRATGLSGEADFSHLGDLLEFEPVPRKKERVDGWTPERQRAFIAALSATGSKRQAALAVGMAAYGVDQMLKSEGSESFKAAFDRAMAIAARHGSMKIAQGVADAAARNAQLTPPSRLRGADPGPAEDEAEEADGERNIEVFESIARKFMAKVWEERKARVTGRIVAADFYLRQITAIEVMLDLMASRIGMPLFELLAALRRDGYGPIQIAETPLSRMLDERRRELWESTSDLERPEHPPERYLRPFVTASGGGGAYRLNTDGEVYGALTTPAAGYSEEQWVEMSYEEQLEARKAKFEAEAAAQIAWEAKAHDEWEARFPSPSGEGQGVGHDL